MATIDGDRLIGDLETLRAFGATGNGVVRPSYSPSDLQARHWLCDRMAQAGLDASIDGVGNVVGRSPRSGPALLLGSHSDTQPTGGWLDGAYGVIAALEVARALGADPATADLAVDVIAFVDEEATYASCLGSRSFVGSVDPTTLDAANDQGETLHDALVRTGLAERELAHLDPARHVGFLEAHIEQGPYLDEAGLDVGVVASIVGITTSMVRFRGEQNHAGTTPMARRRDAAAAMFDFGHHLAERMAAVASATSVWTIGRVRVEPGAQSIIPGFAEVTVQGRDVDPAVLGRFDEQVRALAAEVASRTGVDAEVDIERALDPTPLDQGLRDHLAAAAEAVSPGRWQHMASAAAHDAMILAAHVPAAMVFVPSVGGISHDFAEDTEHHHLVTGARVLAEATVAALRAASV